MIKLKPDFNPFSNTYANLDQVIEELQSIVEEQQKIIQHLKHKPMIMIINPQCEPMSDKLKAQVQEAIDSCQI